MSTFDNDIRKEVSHRLQNDPQLAACRIRAEVSEGIGTLIESAETYQAAALAQERAAQVPGVKKVVNRISVAAPEKIAPPTDQGIRARIQAAFDLEPELRPTDLVLAVADGSVFIEGFVPTLKNRRRIQQMAARERGVVNVHNNLAVVPARVLSDHDIARDIADALESRGRGPQKGLAIGVELGSAWPRTPLPWMRFSGS